MTTSDPHLPAVLIIAFEGWNDAGSAASTAIDLLVDEFDADQLTTVDGQSYYDLQVNRPIVSRNEDGTKSVTWPGTDVYRGTLPSGRTVLLMHSIEPSIRWRDFTSELLGIAEREGVEEVYLLGALLADVPHTRPLPTSMTSSSPRVRQTLGLRDSDYEGPTGIVGVFEAAAAEAGLMSASLWVSVPHYVSDMPSPKATLSLVNALAGLIDEPVDLPELLEDANRWEKTVSEIAEENPEISGYVAQLETTRDTADSPLATGDAIAAEFERYLRRHEK